MNKNKLLQGFIFSLSLILLASCNSEPKFTIEGIISNAKDSMIYLEHRGLNAITVLDSAKIADNGSFELKGTAPQYPDLYTLRLGEQYINLGIDSIETVTVKASKEKFASEYTVEGSENSKMIRDITLKNQEVTALINKLQKQYQDKEISDSTLVNLAMAGIKDFKDLAMKSIASQPWSIAAYYTVFQKINGDLLFDPYDKKDSKMYGAVATQWDGRYKESERAKHLHNFTLTGMKAARMEDAKSKLLENLPVSSDIDLLNITLPDLNGNPVNLKALTGKPIVLDFTAYTAEKSPAHNIELNKVYEKYGSNLIIYQISYDSDVHLWKNAAVNLPWMSLYDQQGIQSPLLIKYNVHALPTTFIIDKAGNVVKRIMPQDNILTEVSKVL